MEYCSAQIVKRNSLIQIKEIVIYIPRFLFDFIRSNFQNWHFFDDFQNFATFRICKVIYFCLLTSAKLALESSANLKFFKEQHVHSQKNREYKARNMKCVNCVAFFGVEINGKNGSVIVEMGVPKFCALILEPDSQWVEIISEGVFQSS